ncbi:von Willebrand factor A domain-containing protein 7 [Portunus trituberculatus]|uniref:von Willebrand factor A domain-containing protein 7 n=1 Tax=Portunus trituberculatus TaxID=210409 RepID=A0A5B7DDM3_PORTR|nr:von Willebrand factor A domain-containing protein 7 [Portunus trituberculatus]
MALSFLPWMVLGCLAITHPCSAFLPTSLNFTDPDLTSLFCPDQMVGQTTDHKAITREALRREVRRFFLDVTPANASLTIPEDASLSEMFRTVYGSSASPARFIKDFYSQSTWIELGRNSILEGLGLPGADIGEVAGPGDATCTDCASASGACTGNVIPTGRLSSGYYEYTAVGADDFIVPKPDGAGKCSHGGPQDASAAKAAVGGINKESTSPCFSPHHHLHQQAVDLAISASEHYIGVLRDAIGTDHFTNLLNLYQGSALSIVIDTTGSMQDEIDTVKEEAKLIVQKSHPELYIFVPYGDPEYGPVTKTSDAEEFLAVLDTVKASGGCCCMQEKFWHGLQLSLINTPDYSTIFCFTDAGANDAELMDGVLALVTAKHCKVNIIYSYNNRQDSCPDYVTSGTEELKYLATISGGLFIELEEFDAGDIDGIMQEGVDENKAGLVKRDNVKAHHEFSFPVDDSISDFDFVIFGAITKASVTDSVGTYIDLMDKDTLAVTDGVEIISHTSKLKAIKFTKPILGDWFFEADGPEYSVSVSASSTLGLLSEFAELDLTPPRPGYVVVRGQPLSRSPFIRLYSTMAQPVECLIELVVADSVLSTTPGHSTKATFRVHNYGPKAEFQYAAIDEEKFIHDWSPHKSTISSMGFVDVEVEFKVPSSASPGTTSTITFTASSLLTEHNINTYITYYIVLDEHEDDVPPTCVSTDVPDCAGYDSEDLCSAKSWLVEATLQDDDSGLLQIYSQPDGDLTLDGFSTGTTHPVTATFNGSCCLRAMNIVGVDVRGNLGYCRYDLGPLKGSVVEIVAEAVGESWVYLRWNISDVRDDLDRYSILIDEDYSDTSRCPNLVCYKNVTYLESCMLHTFTLTAHYKSVDGVVTTGAPKKTDATTSGPAPLPPTNPSIDYTSDTTTSLSWTPPSNRACLDHYQVCFKMYGTTLNMCKSSSNSSIVLDGLEPCAIYHINITSVSVSGQLSEDSLLFDTNTDDAAPGAPRNLRVNNQTEYMVSLAWDNPRDRASCVDKWRISYLKHEVKYQEVKLVADNFATVSDLEACSEYTFFVSAVSPGGFQGGTKTTKAMMEEIEPTAVTSVKATALNASSVEVVWVPAIKEECVHHYLVCVTHLTSLVQECHNDTDLQRTFTGLEACVDYEVTVTPVSPSSVLGSLTYDIARTVDFRPSPPTSLQVTDITSSTAHITFSPPLEHPLCVVEYDFEVQEMKSIKSIKVS